MRFSIQNKFRVPLVSLSAADEELWPTVKYNSLYSYWIFALKIQELRILFPDLNLFPVYSFITCFAGKGTCQTGHLNNDFKVGENVFIYWTLKSDDKG